MTLPRHIVLTGASSGLGRALALEYAAPGRTLSLQGRDIARLSEVAALCRAKGADVDEALIDVTDAMAMAGWLAARDGACPVDMVIANAGLGGAAALAPSGGESMAQAGALFSVNTLGLVHSVTPLLPRMQARGAGHLVIVGSIQGDVGLPQSPAYSASKAAVRIYGDGLRRLLKPQGIGVTIVLPGFIDTPMSRSLGMARPFLWSAERAARRVRHDVARGRRYSVFPWPLRLAVAFGRLAPAPVGDAILALSLRYHRFPDDTPPC